MGAGGSGDLVEPAGYVRLPGMENPPTLEGEQINMANPYRVVVIGAGVGGLTTGAVLARAGMDVTVLEAHIYPGGCAGTFYHQGYRFDAGATLAGGFYPGGPMDLLAEATGAGAWPVRPANPAMVVHLPGNLQITRWTDETRWAEHRAAFGAQGLGFWRWQENTADALWELALRTPTWPPQTLLETASLARDGFRWLGSGRTERILAFPHLVVDAFRPVSAHLRDMPESLRLFIDAQLLISAQTTSENANALYGAAALDLPRRGVVHLQGGMGTISAMLAEALEKSGGRVIYRQEATRIVMQRGRPVAVETKKGASFPADIVIANLPEWNIATLLGEAAPRRLSDLPPRPTRGWGAFMLYLGIEESAIPDGLALHHQVIKDSPLAEGNSVFMSLTPGWDQNRAPQGHRGITLSTHTDLNKWWQLYEHDRPAYEALKSEYTERLLLAAEKVLPEARAAATLTLPGTPVTFQRFTRRAGGWVGGFPQTGLLIAKGPRLGKGLWMVGDSIFPGQSTAAAALGGLRVARSVLASPDYTLENISSPANQRIALH
jgi:C-3',4' desaturase CrtD